MGQAIGPQAQSCPGLKLLMQRRARETESHAVLHLQRALVPCTTQGAPRLLSVRMHVHERVGETWHTLIHTHAQTTWLQLEASVHRQLHVQHGAHRGRAPSRVQRNKAPAFKRKHGESHALLCTHAVPCTYAVQTPMPCRAHMLCRTPIPCKHQCHADNHAVLCTHSVHPCHADTRAMPCTRTVQTPMPCFAPVLCHAPTTCRHQCTS